MKKTLDQTIAAMEAERAKLQKILNLREEIAVLKREVEIGEFRQSDTVRVIISEVCASEKLSVLQLFSKTRTEQTARARQIAAFLIVDLTEKKLTFCEVARIIGKADHGTICHAIRRINGLCETCPSFAARVDRIRQCCLNRLRNPSPHPTPDSPSPSTGRHPANSSTAGSNRNPFDQVSMARGRSASMQDPKAGIGRKSSS